MSNLPQRKPLETKEVTLKSMKDSYESLNKKSIPRDEMNRYERLLEKEILKRVYENNEPNRK